MKKLLKLTWTFALLSVSVVAVLFYSIIVAKLARRAFAQAREVL